jgi:hypothetical protein
LKLAPLCKVTSIIIKLLEQWEKQEYEIQRTYACYILDSLTYATRDKSRVLCGLVCTSHKIV